MYLPTAIKGIGIAHSGVIDSDAGLVLSYPRPGQMAEWKNVPLRQIFQNEFKVPCLLEDSVRTTTTAEKCFGLGRDLSNFPLYRRRHGNRCRDFSRRQTLSRRGWQSGRVRSHYGRRKWPTCVLAETTVASKPWPPAPQLSGRANCHWTGHRFENTRPCRWRFRSRSALN